MSLLLVFLRTNRQYPEFSQIAPRRFPDKYSLYALKELRLFSAVHLCATNILWMGGEEGFWS